MMSDQILRFEGINSGLSIKSGLWIKSGTTLGQAGGRNRGCYLMPVTGLLVDRLIHRDARLPTGCG